MNAATVVSIVTKAALAVSGVLAAFSIITPDQAAQLSANLSGLAGGITGAVSAAVAIYSIIRSIKAHKKDA